MHRNSSSNYSSGMHSFVKVQCGIDKAFCILLFLGCSITDTTITIVVTIKTGLLSCMRQLSSTSNMSVQVVEAAVETVIEMEAVTAVATEMVEVTAIVIAMEVVEAAGIVMEVEALAVVADIVMEVEASAMKVIADKIGWELVADTPTGGGAMVKGPTTVMAPTRIALPPTGPNRGAMRMVPAEENTLQASKEEKLVIEFF